MFYEIFERLCHENQTSPYACCKDIGLNGGTAAYWKKSGKMPKRETLEKIAEKFSVSVNYLLERENQTNSIGIDFGTSQTKIAPANTGESDSIDFSIKTNESEWNTILNKLTRENKIKLFDYLNLLLLSQDQDDKADT